MKLPTLDDGRCTPTMSPALAPNQTNATSVDSTIFWQSILS